MSDIYQDYEDTVRKADRLDEQADRLSNIRSSRIEAALTEIQGKWQGDASLEMLAKISRLYDKVCSEERRLRSEAQKMRNAAWAWYQAEKAAQEALRRAREAEEAARRAMEEAANRTGQFISSLNPFD